MDDTGNTDLKGLGGWLVLVGLGVVLAPIRQLAALIPVYPPIFTEGYWEELTTVGSAAYHPLWGPLIIGEIVVNSAIVLVQLYLIYLFFSKHYRFPKFYISLILFSFVFIVFDAWLATFVLPGEPMFDDSTIKEVSRAIGAAVVWIPYMLISKRVEATFVEKLPPGKMRTDADLFA